MQIRMRKTHFFVQTVGISNHLVVSGECSGLRLCVSSQNTLSHQPLSSPHFLCYFSFADSSPRRHGNSCVWRRTTADGKKGESKGVGKEN